MTSFKKTLNNNKISKEQLKNNFKTGPLKSL